MKRVKTRPCPLVKFIGMTASRPSTRIVQLGSTEREDASALGTVEPEDSETLALTPASEGLPNKMLLMIMEKLGAMGYLATLLEFILANKTCAELGLPVFRANSSTIYYVLIEGGGCDTHDVNLYGAYTTWQSGLATICALSDRATEDCPSKYPNSCEISINVGYEGEAAYYSRRKVIRKKDVKVGDKLWGRYKHFGKYQMDWKTGKRGTDPIFDPLAPVIYFQGIYTSREEAESETRDFGYSEDEFYDDHRSRFEYVAVEVKDE